MENTTQGNSNMSTWGMGSSDQIGARYFMT